MNSKQIIKNIAENIVEAKSFITQTRGPLTQYIVTVGNEGLIFIAETEIPRLDQFAALIEAQITKQYKKLKVEEAFTVANWSISKQEDYNREWTQEEKEDCYKYGYSVQPAQTYDHVFTNNTTEEEFIVTRKAKVNSFSSA